MKSDLLEKIYSISLKTRILREWHKSNRAQEQLLSERELLTLELINDFAPITEKALSKIFGIPFSSVSDLIKNLAEMDLIDITDKARGKPLILKDRGKETLAKTKQSSANRISYLFETLNESECASLMGIFDKINKNAEKAVQQLVFDRYSNE